MMRVITGAALAVAAATVLGSSTLQAQWPKFAPPDAPKTATGEINLMAPAPRTADGKVDLSGVWESGPLPGSKPPAPRPGGPTGVNASIFFNVGAQLDAGQPPYQPWAAELVKKRVADGSKDNPDAHCLPLGIMQNTTHPYPKKIIQTPSEVIVIYEGSGTTVREIYLDGRKPDPDAQPWYNGYSVGRWEGDTLVVETTNFVDDGWLDVNGSPLTTGGRLIERFSRPTYGGLIIDVTVDDPKAYTKPFNTRVTNRLLPDTQLIEFVCIDKSAQHYVGADGVPDAVRKQQQQKQQK
jgi:hypothetical protein